MSRREDILLKAVKANKVAEIDSATVSKIVGLVGNENKQRNLTAKSTQLMLKEMRGDITDEEKATLDELNGMFAQVEAWIVDGNAREQLVWEMTSKEDVEATEV